MTDDRDLRDRFAALRREEEARAPAFAALATSRRQHRRLSPGMFIAAAACVAAILAAVLWAMPLLWKPQHEPGTHVASITEWKPPTDFLLETPGRELLRTVPTIGAWPEDATAPVPPQRHRNAKSPALP
jgi:hypothetical protein